MRDRVNEITFIMNIIQNICEEAKIGIRPHTSDNGRAVLVIRDAVDGEMYTLELNTSDYKPQIFPFEGR